MDIREARKGDEEEILSLIKGLAEYENEPEAVTNTAENLAKDLFEEKVCEALVAIKEGQMIGFALYYTSYSTWKGQCLYLEDLYLVPEERGHGYGSKLFDAVVSIAKDRKCPRMDWQVLDWNTPAIEFYERKDATIDKEWFNGRLFFTY
jgi:GNAT superfamily N-acetyltransferase